MTVSRGSEWGELGPLPDDGVVVRDDASAAALVEQARTEGREPPAIGLLGGDLCRTVGGRGDEARLHTAEAARLVVDVPCTVDEARGFIRERDGFVAIFSGDASGCYKLDELTDLEVPGLPPEAQEAVKKGIEFESRSDLPQILEGLTSTR